MTCIMAFPINDLPIELLIQILSDPGLTRRNHSALRLTCRKIHDIVSPLLFSDIHLECIAIVGLKGEDFRGPWKWYKIVDKAVEAFGWLASEPNSRVFGWMKKITILCNTCLGEPEQHWDNQVLRVSRTKTRRNAMLIVELLGRFEHVDVDIVWHNNDETLADFVKAVCQARRVDLRVFNATDGPWVNHVKNAHTLHLNMGIFEDGRMAHDKEFADMIARCPNLDDLMISQNGDRYFHDRFLSLVPRTHPMKIRRWVADFRQILSLDTLTRLHALKEVLFSGDCRWCYPNAKEAAMWRNLSLAGIALESLSIENPTVESLQYLVSLKDVRSIRKLGVNMNTRYFRGPVGRTHSDGALVEFLWTEAIPAISSSVRNLAVIVPMHTRGIAQNEVVDDDVVLDIVPIDYIALRSPTLVELRLSLRWTENVFTSFTRAIRGCPNIRDLIILLESWEGVDGGILPTSREPLTKRRWRKIFQILEGGLKASAEMLGERDEQVNFILALQDREPVADGHIKPERVFVYAYEDGEWRRDAKPETEDLLKL